MARKTKSGPPAAPGGRPAPSGKPKATTGSGNHARAAAFGVWRGRVASHVIAFVLGIVTILVVLTLAYPTVTISGLSAAGPGKPFHVSFLLKNEGYWAIDRIKVRCNVYSVETGGRSQIMETAVEEEKEIRHGLRAGHQTHMRCAPRIANPGGEGRAVLEITVSYSPWYLPWAWRRRDPAYVYTLERDRERRALWLPEG